MSIRDAIRESVPDIATVTSPKGKPVYIRGLTGAEGRLYSELIEKQKANGGINNAQLICLGLCDEAGVLVYDHANPDDVAELDRIAVGFQRELLIAMLDISGMTAKAVDDAEKNS